MFQDVNGTAGTSAPPVLGIVGAGQLARMTAAAAGDLGCRVRVLSRTDHPSAAPFAEVVVGDWDDAGALAAFAASCDVVTFDHELVPDRSLDALAAGATPVAPSPLAMRRASDKVEQRHLAIDSGLDVAPFRVVRRPSELAAAARELGLPVVVKRARGGYDGRAVVWVRDEQELAALDLDGSPHLVEPELPIERELAITVARRRDGSAVVYPAVETVQDDGICTTVRAPARIERPLEATLRAAALTIADRLGHVGVLSLETFLVDGRLLLNELAPRPHNSAHYTLDACRTSQFENHVRAVLDLPLGSPAMVAPAAAMANLIAVAAEPGLRTDVALPAGTVVHLYDKEPRPGRKVGHLTAVGADPSALEQRVTAIADLVTGNAGAPQPDRRSA